MNKICNVEKHFEDFQEVERYATLYFSVRNQQNNDNEEYSTLRMQHLIKLNRNKQGVLTTSYKRINGNLQEFLKQASRRNYKTIAKKNY